MAFQTFKRTSLAIAVALLAIPTAHALPERASASPTELMAQLKSNSGNSLTNNAISVDAYNAVYAVDGAVLSRDNTSAQPLERAQTFLSIYGALSGITDSANQLQWVMTNTDKAGVTHVALNQVQSGLPVFGARIMVHMDATGITGMNGVFVKGLEGLSTTPAKDIAVLRANALTAAKKLHPKATALSVEASHVVFYNTGLLQSREGSNHLAYEIVVRGSAPADPIREKFILDANNGYILNRIDLIETVLHRKTYTPTYGTSLVYEEGNPVGTVPAPADPAFRGDTSRTTPSARPHYQPLDNLHIYAGGTYKLYNNLFGRDGYDDVSASIKKSLNGGTAHTDPTKLLQESVLLANDQCPNAYWNGVSANYCPGFDLDDVVSHEWSHAYTEYMSGLVYQYQSGALNEAYSDIFGETYDLINGFEGDVGTNFVEGKYYKQKDVAGNPGSRWVVGEDLSQTAAEVLLRDMWDPDNFFTPSPGKVGSVNYDCSTSDNGGVHTNSGVGNHAYAMLVDGLPNTADNTTFNGIPVPGIGMVKAANVYFLAKLYEGPTTNYTQHADALDKACNTLKTSGVKLKDVFGAVTTQVITQADCDAVDASNRAVAYRTPSKVACPAYVAVLKAESTTPALCPSGKVAAKFFSEGFNGATFPATWVQGKNVSGDTDIPGWKLSTTLPAPHSGSAAFFENNQGGTCTTGGDQSASHYVDTPAISTPVATGFLTFTHFMQSEAGYDGGNLKVSVNGGAFVIVPVAGFTYNGHSGKFLAALGPTTPTGNNTSPNANQAAWTGSDQGEATGSWGTTIVDLSKLTTPATAGGTVKFRFDFANDGCGGNLGWFIDQVDAYQCIVNTIPTAAFKTITPVSGDKPLAVAFDVSTSSDVDAGDSVASYTIDFGDGSALVTQASATFNHTYTVVGQYTPKLTVTDTRGAVSTQVSGALITVKEVVQQAANVSFVERINVPVGYVITSEPVTVSGFTGLLDITPGSGMQYSINGGAFTSSPGKISANDKLVVRHVSAAAEGTVRETTISIGSSVVKLKSTTTTLDHTPDAFDFGLKDGQAAGELTASNAIVPVNYDDAPISAGPGADYRINGGAWTRATGTVKKGDKVQARHTASTQSLGYTKSYIKIGGVVGYYTSRTAK